MNKNIVVFGCKKTTKIILDLLHEKQELSALITISPELADKNSVADYEDLSYYAKEKNIKLIVASSYNLTDSDDIKNISDLNIDIAFVIGWQRLIPANILGIIKIGAFGMHGSSLNLPIGRGRSPMNWALIEGRKVFYTNLFKYDSGVDSGDILDTFKFNILDRDNAETMHYKNSLAMKTLIQINLEKIKQNDFKLRKQPDLQPTYYPKRLPSDGLIDWDNDVFEIEKFIRAITFPFRGAFTYCNGKEITILDAQIFDYNDFGYTDLKNGSIIEVLSPDKFLVKGFSGVLLINSFISDYTPKVGDSFDNNGKEIKYFPRNKYGFFDMPN